MKRFKYFTVLAVLFLAVPVSIPAQHSVTPVQTLSGDSSPDTQTIERQETIVTRTTTTGQVQVVQDITAIRESLALTYPEGPTISIKFQGTSRLPNSSGEAKIERKKGMTEIEIELDEMKPAVLFGGDYNTYVLWTVSPEGHVDNVGEFILRGNRSKLNVSTPLETFGMFITAEPHFLVSSPSRFVVMENTRPANDIAGNLMKVSRIKYRGFEGKYDFSRETLANVPEASGEIRADIAQARTSVALAEEAGAGKFAAAELQAARDALQRAEAADVVGASGPNKMLFGHEVVRLAYEAQKLAEQRAFQAALDAERRTNAEQTQRLETAISAAQSAAERSRLEAEQRQLQLQMEERARQQAMAEAQAARLDAERARGEAVAARQEASTAKADRDRLAQEADRLKAEREAERRRLQEALGQVVEIRESARGLILNIPDILFDFDRASLKPQAREILSKIAGILQVTRGYRLAIEGHTDAIGTEEYNERLSERRAESVRSYLLSAGVSRDIVEQAVGLGESQPIASNQDAGGRQRNRRVEIIVQDTIKGQTTTIPTE